MYPFLLTLIPVASARFRAHYISAAVLYPSRIGRRSGHYNHLPVGEHHFYMPAARASFDYPAARRKLTYELLHVGLGAH